MEREARGGGTRAVGAGGNRNNPESVRAAGQRASAQIRSRMAELGITQLTLAARLQHYSELPSLSQTAAWKWIEYPERQAPYRVFAMEQALELPPGTLSRFLGFGPPDPVQPPRTIQAFLVMEGSDLTPEWRAAVVAIWETARKSSRAQRAR